MNSKRTKAEQIWRRGELMAELFLQDLEPEYVAQATAQDFAFDFLVGFANEEGGINAHAVEVKATEKPVGTKYRLPRDVFDRLANSNIPVLLLVVDVKQNELFFAWPVDHLATISGGQLVAVPVDPIDDESKNAIRARMASKSLNPSGG